MFWKIDVLKPFRKSLEKYFGEVRNLIESYQKSETTLKMNDSTLSCFPMILCSIYLAILNWKITCAASTWYLLTCFLIYFPKCLQIIIIFSYFINFSRFNILCYIQFSDMFYYIITQMWPLLRFPVTQNALKLSLFFSLFLAPFLDGLA